MIESSYKIKVLMISETSSGGARKHIVELLSGLNKTRYNITFVYSAKRADSVFLNNLKELKALNIKLIELSMERNISPLADIKSFFKLTSILRKNKPDIIHLHAAKAGALGRIAALFSKTKNIIYNPHGGSFHKFNDRLGFLYLIVEKLLASKNIHFIGVSDYSCRLFEEVLHIPKTNNHLIYNGIKVIESADDEENLRLKYSLKKDDFIILYPAMFYSEKGHLEFLNAYDRLDETINPVIKILLAGDGPLEKIIRDRVKDLKLDGTISFLGFVEKMEDYFKISNLVILPSQKEFLPYVILEAMSYSKPILATNTGAIIEMIRNGVNGELFYLNNLTSLWQRMNYFCLHKVELEQMSVNSKKILNEKFSLSGMISKTEDLYDSLCNITT
jgi:glycosyltransferase involved in cell wall biosynthesis